MVWSEYCNNSLYKCMDTSDELTGKHTKNILKEYLLTTSLASVIFTNV